MAIFGAPLPQDDAPVRAVRSALKVRERLMRAVSPLVPELRFKVRYGINTGQAIVGISFRRTDGLHYYSVHAVNIASRISQAADPDQILIGPETYEQIKDTNLFVVEKAGVRILKGLKSKMRLYEVKGFA